MHKSLEVIARTSFRGRRGPEAIKQLGAGSKITESPVRVVICDGPGSEARPIRAILVYSPSGYDWGIGGVAARDLALSMLAEVFDDGSKAAQEKVCLSLALCQEFAHDVIADLPRVRWDLSGARIVDWLAGQGVFYNGISWRILGGGPLDLLIREDMFKKRILEPLWELCVESPKPGTPISGGS